MKKLVLFAIIASAAILTACTNEEPMSTDTERATRSYPQFFSTYVEAVDYLIECEINSEDVEVELFTKCKNRLPEGIYNSFCYALQDEDPWEGTEYCWQNTALLAIEVLEWGYDNADRWKPMKTKYTLWHLMGGSTLAGYSFSYQLPEMAHEYIDVYDPYRE